MSKKNEKTNITLNIQHTSLPTWDELPEIELYMDQVIVLMEKYLSDSTYPDNKIITPSMINNYVKLGIMPAPIKKKYSREHLAYLVIICSLKQVVPLPNIKEIMENRLKSHSISEILDFYSNLYDFAFNTVIENCQNFLNSEKSNIKYIEDVSIFSAIAAANCRNISTTLFFMDNPQKNNSKILKKEN